MNHLLHRLRHVDGDGNDEEVLGDVVVEGEENGLLIFPHVDRLALNALAVHPAHEAFGGLRNVLQKFAELVCGVL